MCNEILPNNDIELIDGDDFIFSVDFLFDGEAANL